MLRPQAARPSPIGVKRLAEYLKRKLDLDQNLKSVAVRGEISNLNISQRGHFNFDLKEGEAILRCFAWEDKSAYFPVLRNGQAVVASGAISTWAPKSQYQLTVIQIALEGVGDVHALFDERKRKLAAEGLFDAARKRPIPPFPFRVALVSSRAANGAIDFVTLLRGRAPHVEIVWCETAVQGPGAPAEIVAALGRASRAEVDLIVVTRGGGSFEDLFAFSDEAVVRAVARARHPVISAIGHTADQQLCDFAADVHVETPSAAAKAVGFSAQELRVRIGSSLERARRVAEGTRERLQSRLERALVRSKLGDSRLFLAGAHQRVGDAEQRAGAAFESALRGRSDAVRALVRRLEARDPSRRLAERARRLQAGAFKLEAVARASLERRDKRLAVVVANLDGKNPEAILQRGYSIVTYRNAIVRDASAVPVGERIAARVARGTLEARVERTGEE
jgi:exodeoxyribonuclease VII large subunit